MDTQQLITLLRSGDTSPLKFLFEQYGPYCQRLLQQQTDCPPEVAEDVFMEALLVFRRNVLEEKVKIVNYPKTYLYTICYYLYRAGQQQQQRQTRQQPEVARALYRENQDLPEHEQLEQEAILRRQNRRVMAAFERLGPRCRQLLRYFYVENKSLQEIAELMQRSADSVKSSRYRCFQQWKDYLDDPEG